MTMSAEGRTRSRRTFLRGVGVTMALPWLESIPVWGAGAAGSCPKRFAALFMGCGVNPTHWWAKGSGAGMELGRCLEPLAPLKAKINVVNGLFNKHATGVGIHPGQTGNILSGAALQKGAELKGGVSVDQVLARQLGEATAQPSLVLGCEKSNPSVHKNYSMLYSSHISWSSPTTPTPLEVYPALAFDRDKARGFRLDIPAGTAVRFEPGQTREVALVAYAGDRVVYGFNALVSGKLDA